MSSFIFLPHTIVWNMANTLSMSITITINSDYKKVINIFFNEPNFAFFNIFRATFSDGKITVFLFYRNNRNKKNF
jgi:hypothetical protein